MLVNDLAFIPHHMRSLPVIWARHSGVSFTCDRPFSILKLDLIEEEVEEDVSSKYTDSITESSAEGIEEINWKTLWKEARV
jgi:hypothetical protein